MDDEIIDKKKEILLKKIGVYELGFYELGFEVGFFQGLEYVYKQERKRRKK